MYNIPQHINFEIYRDEPILSISAADLDSQLFASNFRDRLLSTYIDQVSQSLYKILSLFSEHLTTAYQEDVYKSDEYTQMAKFYGFSKYDSIVPFSWQEFKNIITETKLPSVGISSDMSYAVGMLSSHCKDFNGLFALVSHFLLRRHDMFQDPKLMAKFFISYFHSDEVSCFLDIVFWYCVFDSRVFIPIFNDDEQMTSICLSPVKNTKSTLNTPFYNSPRQVIRCPRISYAEFAKALLNIEISLITSDIHNRMRTVVNLYKQMTGFIDLYKSQKTVIEFKNPYSWA